MNFEKLLEEAAQTEEAREFSSIIQKDLPGAVSHLSSMFPPGQLKEYGLEPTKDASFEERVRRNLAATNYAAMPWYKKLWSQVTLTGVKGTAKKFGAKFKD